MSTGELFRRYRTEQYFEKHHISVVAEGYPSHPSIIVSTHPTLDETRIYRAIDPKAFHLVHADATSRTRIRTVDEQWALRMSGIIPVYSHNHYLRSRSYQMVRDQLVKHGRSVVLHPTGETAGVIELPDQSEIHLGGLIRMLQETDFLFPVVPAYIDIMQKDITDAARIADGSLVKVIFGEALPVETLRTTGSLAETRIMQQQIWDSWRQLQLGNR